MSDQQAIRQLIEEWGISRDGADWGRLASLWHPEGRMNTTWCEVSGAEFIERSRRAWEAGLIVTHALGGTCVEVKGARAIAQSRVQITQRAVVHGVTVDVDCRGRFWDALEKRDGRWGLILRQPIYEMDRMVTVDPAARVELDRKLLESFPVGYRHLAYLQKQIGLDVRNDLPGLRGVEVEALMARGVRWLNGDSADCLNESSR